MLVGEHPTLTTNLLKLGDETAQCRCRHVRRRLVRVNRGTFRRSGEGAAHRSTLSGRGVVCPPASRRGTRHRLVCRASYSLEVGASHSDMRGARGDASNSSDVLEIRSGAPYTTAKSYPPGALPHGRTE